MYIFGNPPQIYMEFSFIKWPAFLLTMDSVRLGLSVVRWPWSNITFTYSIFVLNWCGKPRMYMPSEFHTDDFKPNKCLAYVYCMVYLMLFGLHTFISKQRNYKSCIETQPCSFYLLWTLIWQLGVTWPQMTIVKWPQMTIVMWQERERE